MKHNPLSEHHITPKLKQWLQLNPRWDAETRQDKLDRFIFRVFPAAVAVCAVATIIAFLIDWGDHTPFEHFLYSACLSYAALFLLLGLPAFALSEHHVIKRRFTAVAYMIAAAVLGLILWFFFRDETDPEGFISNLFWFLDTMGLGLDMYSVVLGAVILMIIFVLVSYGVLTVLVAYFRKNYHRILLSLEKNDDSRLCRTSRKYFMIPGYIDISEVTLEPEVEDKVFQKNVFVRILSYEIIVGLVIASYLFLNPVFLETIDYVEMMILVMLISLFLSTLVVPVSIVRSLGAAAHSSGNRPYYLWEGMKNKLFHPAFYFGLFLTLMWISVFLEMDWSRIAAHYIGYFVFMALLGTMVSFTYVNVYYVPFKNGIIRNFYQRKQNGRK